MQNLEQAVRSSNNDNATLWKFEKSYENIKSMQTLQNHNKGVPPRTKMNNKAMLVVEMGFRNWGRRIRGTLRCDGRRKWI